MRLLNGFKWSGHKEFYLDLGPLIARNLNYLSKKEVQTPSIPTILAEIFVRYKFITNENISYRHEDARIESLNESNRAVCLFPGQCSLYRRHSFT